MMQSTGLRKVQLSRRSVAPSACRRWALGAGLGPSGSQRNGAATESMTTRRTIPRDSSTGTFLCTHSSSVSWRPGGGRHCPHHPHLPLRLAPRDPLRPSRLTPESLAGLARPPCRPSPRPGPVLRGPHACLNTWTWPRRQSQPVPAVITGTAPSSGGSGAALSPAQQRARGQVCPPGSAWSMENPGPCPGCKPGSGRRAGARGRVQVPRASALHSERPWPGSPWPRAQGRQVRLLVWNETQFCASTSRLSPAEPLFVENASSSGGLEGADISVSPAPSPSPQAGGGCAHLLCGPGSKSGLAWGPRPPGVPCLPQSVGRHGAQRAGAASPQAGFRTELS